MRRVVVVACLVGCFSKPPPPGTKPLDGGTLDDGLVDAPTSDAKMCASWGGFGDAQSVSGLVVPSMIEPTMSSDGRDVIYRNGTSELVEATRTNLGGAFDPSNPVTGLPGSDVTPAWLSSNRLNLYVVDGTQLFHSMRSTTDGSFALGVAAAQDVQDATLSSDESFAVWATTTTGVLEYGPPDDGLANELLTVNGVTLTSPSIGDHDRSLVWVESAPTPMHSRMYIADFTLMDGQLQLGQPQPIELGTNMFNAGTILSDDGSTLYFTSAMNASGPPQLLVSYRSCN